MHNPKSKIVNRKSGSIVVVGLGPGDLTQLTPAARQALESADVIYGYKTYLRLIAEVAPEIPREGSGMRQEVDRVNRVVDEARAGKRVALISSGDAGVYGMAGLVYEVLRERGDDEMAVEVIPHPRHPKLILPVHQHALVDCGVYLIENIKLDELIDLGRNEFCFVLLSVKFKGATGCPVRPVAMF